MKTRFYAFFAILVLVLLASCSNDNEGKSDNLVLKARSIYNQGKVTAASPNAVVSLTSFTFNFKEIEFEFAENSSNDDDGFFDSDDEIELNGPFVVNVLNNTIDIAALNVPAGVYEEVEFTMSRNKQVNSPMYNKSVQIEGTINGTPFVFWHNIEEDFEIDYEDAAQNLIIDNTTSTLYLNFDLNAVVNSIDFSVATDNDGDGVIEINPNDQDGNQSLANLIKDRIKDTIELDD
jgi:hypothetical protein